MKMAWEALLGDSPVADKGNSPDFFGTFNPSRICSLWELFKSKRYVSITEFRWEE